MPKKTPAPPKWVDPKKQPVRRPDQKEAAPNDRKHPTRDTRETPAPNPNGERVDGAKPRASVRRHCTGSRPVLKRAAVLYAGVELRLVSFALIARA